MKMKKTVVVLGIALAVAAGCKRSEQPAGTTQAPESGKAAQTQTPAPAETSVSTDVGSVMPEYSALGLDGSKFDLASKRDKVVLLNVWATWCGPCRYEIPELQAIHDKYAPKGFEVIGVSVDESGIEAVKQFVDEQKMRYPVVLDAEGKLANMLQTSVLPTSIIVDRTGKVVWKKFGAILPNDEELDKAIHAAL